MSDPHLDRILRDFQRETRRIEWHFWWRRNRDGVLALLFAAGVIALALFAELRWLR